MANVTITVPDAVAPQLIACLRDNYPQYGPDGENLTDVQLLKRAVANHLRDLYANYMANAARVQAGVQVTQKIEQAQADMAGIG